MENNHHTVQGGHLGPERVGVIGLGAIGGSIAWSATRAGLSQVVGFAAVTLARDVPSDAKFGSGARDTTRLAASSVEMWRDLMELNRRSLLKSVESFQRHLESLATALQHRDSDAIAQWLEKGADFRRSLSE